MLLLSLVSKYNPKIGSLGLKTELHCNPEFKLQVKSLAALIFVPIQEIKDVYKIIGKEFITDDDDLQDTYNTLLTYIEGPLGMDPKFPIRLWNHYDAAAKGSPKTTNCC